MSWWSKLKERLRSWLPGRKKDEEKPLLSLVWLLRAPRHLDDRLLAAHVKEAWGIDLADTAEDATEFVAGFPPSLIVRTADQMHLVNTFPIPYVKDKEALAEEIDELRRRQAVLDHEAWLSVDLLGDRPADAAGVRAAYRKVGRLMAELADEDCLAIYCPETGQLIPHEAELPGRLRGGDVLDALTASPLVDVFSVDGEDPRMKAAVAEARERWPEFVAAFEQREPDDNFAAKAPFTEADETEFMWLLVDAIEGDFIWGRLDSDPVHIKRIKCGSRVRVPLAELNDWVFRSRGQEEGLFTTQAILRIRREAQGKTGEDDADEDE